MEYKDFLYLFRFGYMIYIITWDPFPYKYISTDVALHHFTLIARSTEIVWSIIFRLHEVLGLFGYISSWLYEVFGFFQSFIFLHVQMRTKATRVKIIRLLQVVSNHCWQYWWLNNITTIVDRVQHNIVRSCFEQLATTSSIFTRVLLKNKTVDDEL